MGQNVGSYRVELPEVVGEWDEFGQWQRQDNQVCKRKELLILTAGSGLYFILHNCLGLSVARYTGTICSQNLRPSVDSYLDLVTFRHAKIISQT